MITRPLLAMEAAERPSTSPGRAATARSKAAAALAGVPDTPFVASIALLACCSAEGMREPLPGLRLVLDGDEVAVWALPSGAFGLYGVPGIRGGAAT
jgi:hypothetical protein